MKRRTRRTLLIVAAVLLLLAVAVFLRSKAPPEAARLLPESDGIVYINLKPIRAFFHKDLKPPERVPEYQQFIDATGIDSERDLDQAAIALHRMPDPNGPNGPVAYSMVLVGKITGQRLNAWLDAHATSRETYAGHTIYSIPSEGRTVRVAQIGYDMIAVSNTPHPGADSLHRRPPSHRRLALLRLLAARAPLPRRAAALARLGRGPNRPALLRERRHSHLRPFAAARARLHHHRQPCAGAARSQVHSARCACASKRSRPPKPQPPARPPLWPRSSPWRAALPCRSAPTPPTTALKELLKTAEVTQHGERVVVTATLPSSFFANL